MRPTLLAAAVLAATAAHGADTSGEFAIKGAGLQSCGALATAWDGQTADVALYAGWIDGYLTGVNQYLAGTFDAAPWQSAGTMLAITREFCRVRPAEARVMDVFNDVLRDFLPVRLQEKSPAVGLERDGKAVVLYAETLERLEARLADEGFDPGPADGVFDDATAAALEQFQAARSLPATGLPDQQTLFQIFVSTRP